MKQLTKQEISKLRRRIVDKVVMEDCSIEGIPGVSNEPCWVWQGGRASEDYPIFEFNNRTVSVRRMAYLVFVGKELGILTLRSVCRTVCCVNPAHMKVHKRAKGGRPKAGAVRPERLFEEDW